MKLFIRTCAAVLLLSSAAMAESIVRVGVSQRDIGSMDPAFGIGNGDEFPMRQLYSVLVGPKTAPPT